MLGFDESSFLKELKLFRRLAFFFIIFRIPAASLYVLTMGQRVA
jgi:hypothetical protein